MYSKEQFDNKYDKIKKILVSGNIDKETWTKLNKTFITRTTKEIYSGDYMKDEIINYYKELYESTSNPEKEIKEIFLSKINEILLILLSQSDIKNERPIWPPKSHTLDYNGFSQSEIEKIIRGKTISEEIINFNNLLREICETKENSELFIHQTSKSILFKKKDNIKGGIDIRVINILPGWLIILEKLALPKIRKFIAEKINQQQFGFHEGSDCNMTKISTWYNSSKLGYKKLLLIDIRKAFDSIIRIKLKKMIQTDFTDYFF